MSLQGLANLLKGRTKELRHATVFVCGLAGAGKTTLCHGLIELLPSGSTILRQDWFTRFITQERLARIASARDSGDTIALEREENPFNWHDLGAFFECAERLVRTGGLVLRGAFDQRTGRKDATFSVKLGGSSSLLLCDGIYLLHPLARMYSDQVVFIDIPFETSVERVRGRDGHRASDEYLRFKAGLRRKHDLPYATKWRKDTDIVMRGTSPRVDQAE